MQRLLITGAGGFIGRHCIAPAIAAGYEVHGLTSSRKIPDELQQAQVVWHAGDLLREGAAADLLQEIKPSHLLHTAWITAHGDYWSSPKNLDWISAGAHLAKAFGANGGRRFVSTGSCAEYDWGHDWLRECDTPERPNTLYGACKLVHHDMLQSATRHLGFTAATGRIFFAYGPHENPKRLIPYACQQLNAGLDVQLTDCNFWRDFMHVADVAAGLIALLGSDIQGACNVCSGKPILISKMMTQLGSNSGHVEAIRLGAIPNRPGEPRRVVGSNELLRSTGWSPLIPIEAGLRTTLAWWKDNAL